MSFIELDSEYQNAKEPEVAPEGRYDLVVAKVEEAAESKSGKGHIVIPVTLVFEGDGADEYSPFRHWLVIPNADAEDNVRRILNLNLKRFFHAFDVEIDGGFDPADLLGARARDCRVSVETQEEDREGNKLETPFVTNKLALPKLPRED